MDSYRFGAGRYIQENNALDFCGEEIKRYGNKAYVIGGNTAIAVTEKRLCSSFEKYGLAYCMERFSGYPSVQKIEGLKAVVKEKDCNVLVGVGGGRIMDLVKAAAFGLGIPIVAIPTQAATCAAYSPLSVLYTPEVLNISLHKIPVHVMLHTFLHIQALQKNFSMNLQILIRWKDLLQAK